jgi:hypothetical protein
MKLTGVIKSMNVRWLRHVATAAETKMHKTLVAKHEKKSPLGDPDGKTAYWILNK